MGLFNNKRDEVVVCDGVKGILLKDIGDVNSILNLSFDKVLSNGDLRLDMLVNSFERDEEVYFISNFSLELLGRRRQGFDTGRIFDILNVLLSYYKLPKILNLSEFRKDMFSKEILTEIREDMPPVIVSFLPDGTLHLEDGNHRVALAEVFLGFKDLCAFVRE